MTSAPRTSDMPPASPQRPSRKRRWLLIASLGLNLCLIGFMVVGAMKYNWHREDSWAFRGMLHYMQDRHSGDWYLHRLEEPDQALMRRLKSEYGQTFNQSWQDGRTARASLRDLIRAGERDPERLRAVLREIRNARLAGSEVLEALIIDLAEEMSDDAYTDLAGRPRHWDR